MADISTQALASKNSNCDERPAVMKPVLQLLIVLALFVSFASAEEPSFPEGSAEDDALQLAAPFSLANPDFTLRQDYWRGELTAEKGTAFRLQFFKGNIYRLFFAIHRDEIPEGAILHLHVVDRHNRELAHAMADENNVVELSYTVKKTDQYLILMRIVLPDDSPAESVYDGLMIYGWE